MEGFRNRRISLTLAVVFTTFLLQLPALAQKSDERDTPSTTSVYTTSDAAVVEASRDAGSSSGSIKSRSGQSCYLRPDVSSTSYANSRIYAEHAAKGEVAFDLICDGKFVAVVWRPRDPAPGAPVQTPRDLAERLREEIPMPQVTVRANPGVGLVGTESWFWIDGYSGEPITRGTDALGTRIEVEARPSRYEWSFGDGATLISNSAGKAYPETSDVRHTYEKASPAYDVRVRFAFEIRYRVGGGAWTGLPNISRSAAASYRVRESQAVISR